MKPKAGLTQLELANGLGLSVTTVKILLSKGMPRTDVESARKWRAENVGPPGGRRRRTMSQAEMEIWRQVYGLSRL